MSKKILYKIGIDEVGRGPVAGPVAVGGVFYAVELEKELSEKLKGMTDSKKLSEKKREGFLEEVKKLKSEKYFDENLDKSCTDIPRNRGMNKKGGDLSLEGLCEFERKNPEDFSAVEERGEFNSFKIFSSVVFVSAKDVDKFGIVPSIQKALNSVLENILESKELSAIATSKEVGPKIDLDQIKVLLDGGLKAPEKFKNQETIVKGDQKEFSISCASVVAKVLRDRKMVEYGKEFPEYFFEKHKGYGTKLHMESIKKHGICHLHRKTFLKKI
jgi:ribonuclease HII